MKIGKYEFPDDLQYDGGHNWARVEGNEVVQGVTEFGAKVAGEIIYVEPVAVGRHVRQGQPLLCIESGKWVGQVCATVSGEVTAFNVELDRHAGVINKDPYGKGWLVRLKPDCLEDDLSWLRRATEPEYQAFVETERRKYCL